MKKLGIGLLILFLAFGCAKNNATHSFKDGNAQYQLKNYQEQFSILAGLLNSKTITRKLLLQGIMLCSKTGTR